MDVSWFGSPHVLVPGDTGCRCDKHVPEKKPWESGVSRISVGPVQGYRPTRAGEARTRTFVLNSISHDIPVASFLTAAVSPSSNTICSEKS